jgi:hypothetical protein
MRVAVSLRSRDVCVSRTVVPGRVGAVPCPAALWKRLRHAVRCRLAGGGGRKPPRIAPVKSRGCERRGKDAGRTASLRGLWEPLSRRETPSRATRGAPPWGPRCADRSGRRGVRLGRRARNRKRGRSRVARPPMPRRGPVGCLRAKRTAGLRPIGQRAGEPRTRGLRVGCPAPGPTRADLPRTRASTSGNVTRGGDGPVPGFAVPAVEKICPSMRAGSP